MPPCGGQILATNTLNDTCPFDAQGGIAATMEDGAGEIHAITLTNIVQTVRLEAPGMSTMRAFPVLGLRDAILPLVGAAAMYDAPPAEPCASPLAGLRSLNEKNVGLVVSALLGQRQIVVEPQGEPSGRIGDNQNITFPDKRGKAARPPDILTLSGRGI